MVHPDYQYTPKLIPAMASMIAYGEFDAVLASRILGTGALEGGMPIYKYVANRFLTLFREPDAGAQAVGVPHRLPRLHPGNPGAAAAGQNSNDFVFDNQMLAQIVWFGYRIGELTCPTRYFEDASSINFRRSVTYGLGVLKTSLQFRLQKWGLHSSAIFSGSSRERSGHLT